MTAKMDQAPARLQLSDPALQEAILNGEADKLSAPERIRALDSQLQRIMTHNEWDQLASRLMSNPEIAQRYRGQPELKQDVLRFQASLAQEDFAKKLREAREELSKPAGSEKVKFSEHPLRWAWEKLTWPIRNPGKTALVLALAYFAAPQILNLVASTEFASTRPEVMRAIEYLRSFLAFGTGGTGVKAGAIAEPIS